MSWSPRLPGAPRVPRALTAGEGRRWRQQQQREQRAQAARGAREAGGAAGQEAHRCNGSAARRGARVPEARGSAERFEAREHRGFLQRSALLLSALAPPLPRQETQAFGCTGNSQDFGGVGARGWMREGLWELGRRAEGRSCCARPSGISSAPPLGRGSCGSRQK